MKALKVTKYQLNSFKHATSTFYGIFIAINIFLISISNKNNVNITSSGIEFATIIFIFIVGLNIFKESFYFLKANNVSRKDYLIGTTLSLISFSAIVSIIDVVLNRLYNIFIKSPMIYDMVFGSYNYFNNGTWVQESNILTLLGSFLLQSSLCLVAISLGFLINLMYYRANKIVKLIISISPVILIALINFISKAYPNFIYETFEKIWIKTFDILTTNVYTFFISLIIVFLIETTFSHLLVRRAIIKE